MRGPLGAPVIRNAAVIIVGLAMALAAAAPSAGSTPAPSPSPDGSTSYQVNCDNGSTYLARQPAGDGSVTVGHIPAGSDCSVVLVGPNATIALPPIPAGGSLSANFNGPYVRVSPTVGYPGFTARVSGQGFPPDAPVTLSWSTPGDASSVTRADADGSFTAWMLVPSGDPTGMRTLLASAAGENPVTASYLVEPSNFEPSGNGGQEFRR